MRRKNDTAKRDVTHYLSLPYVVEIIPIPPGEGGGYNACVPLLGRWSAVGDGDTPEAAYTSLRAALPSLLEEWLARGIAIPEPGPESGASVPSQSGRLSLRIPRTLHAQAAQAAQEEGVSINQLISVTLAQALGGRKAEDRGGVLGKSGA